MERTKGLRVGRWVLAIVAAACAGALIFFRHTERGTVVCNGVPIEVGEVSTLMTMANVHASPVRYVQVFGVRYANAQGLRPYYLYVPEINSIVFVTEPLSTGGGRIGHVINLGTGRHIPIAGVDNFGSEIGFGGRSRDRIDVSDPTHLLLSTRFADWSLTTLVNLDRGELELQTFTTYLESGEVKEVLERRDPGSALVKVK